MKLLTATLFAAALSLAISGCGKSTPEAESPPAPAPEPAADAKPAEPETKPEAAAPPPEKPLTDGEIAAIVKITNDGEIDQAKLAGLKAKDAKVKKLAATIAQHHGASNKNGEKIIVKAKIAPTPSALAEKIMADGKAATDTFKDLKGADFDKAYLTAQIAAHQAVLALFDAKLLPAVQNADLKKELTDFRPKIEANLKEAQSLHAALAPAPAPAPGAGQPAAKESPAKK